MIPSAETKITYIGDGKTKIFPFAFKYNDAADVKVAIYDILNDVTKVIKKDYYVDTVANVVKYPGYPPGQEAPQNEQPPVLTKNWKIVVYRETPISQEIDLGDKYPLELLENMHDKPIMILQEILEMLNRCVMASIGSATTAEEMIEAIHNDRLSANASASHAENMRDEAAKSATDANLYAKDSAQYAQQSYNSSNEAKQWADESKAYSVIALSYSKAADTSATMAAGSADIAAIHNASAEKYKELAKSWAEDEASPDNMYDSKSPTKKTQSSRTWSFNAKDFSLSAQQASDNALGAAQQCQGIVDNALTILRESLNPKARVVVRLEDGRVVELQYVVDSTTGKIYPANNIFVGEAAPPDGANLWIKLTN